MKKTAVISISILLLCMFSSLAVKAESTDLNPEWQLTQYSDDSGNQAMFYSLYNEQQKALILIDGGWVQNADHVRKVIEDHGGYVTAWFLTHYHGDHCDAFNTLWEEYRDKIGMVYCTPLKWEDVESVFQYWDTPETFSTFLSQTEGADNVTRLYRDDELEVCGLKIKVYSAFDEEIPPIGDIPNNCSLVFKICSENQSVLFLGDMWNRPYGMTLLERYGAEELHADYVQSAHHGNNTQTFEFYKAVDPSVIFLDGPEWLMTSEDHTAKDTIAWCEENGIKTYDYRQAPTTLPLR